MTLADIEHIMALCLKYQEISPDRILLGSHNDVLPSDRAHVAEQLRLNSLLKRKLSTWSEARVFIPSGLNLEQCSSEATARYKASILVQSNERLLDLTGGLGVDFWAMAQRASESFYVEAQEILVQAAHYNFAKVMPQHIHSVTICHGEALELLPRLLPQINPTLVYLDPARREGANKYQRVYAIDDCTPNLTQVLELIKASGVPSRIAVKLSPMLDIKHTLLAYPNISSVQITALRNEVKELILLFDPTRCHPNIGGIPITATDLTPNGPQSFTSTLGLEESYQGQYAISLGSYIYEPNAAIMKSGLYSSVAEHFALLALHPHTHLYTSDNFCSDFVGRTFELIEIIPFKSSIIKGLAKRIPQAEISCRNFPLRPDVLRSKLRIASGGNNTIMATTLADNSHVLLLLKRLL